MVTDEQWGHI